MEKVDEKVWQDGVHRICSMQNHSNTDCKIPVEKPYLREMHQASEHHHCLPEQITPNREKPRSRNATKQAIALKKLETQRLQGI